jgi:hypothetical protein
LEEDGMALLRELNPRFEDEGAEMTGSGAVIEMTGSGVDVEMTGSGADVEMTGSGADVETTGSGAGVWVPSCVPR